MAEQKYLRGDYDDEEDDDILFSCTASKGFPFKIFHDGSASFLKRTTIHLTKKGIQIRDDDATGEDAVSESLFDLILHREKFAQYYCNEDLLLSFNTKHMKGLLKSVKKKDSVGLEVRDPGDGKKIEKIYIIVTPEGSSGKCSRTERYYLAVQEEDIDEYEMCDLPPDRYHYPMVIPSADFQKLKKFSNVSKTTISVKAQAGNYLEFQSESGAVFGGEMVFGKLLKNPKKIDLRHPDVDEGEGDFPFLYDARFSGTTLAALTKFGGLEKRMQIFAPEESGYPLKICMEAGDSGGLGVFTAFIKDKRQIEFERSEHERELGVNLDRKLTAKKKKK